MQDTHIWRNGGLVRRELVVAAKGDFCREGAVLEGCFPNDSNLAFAKCDKTTY